MNCFDKELHVAMVNTASIIINYANDVAGVWDRVLQDYLMLYGSATHIVNTVSSVQCTESVQCTITGPCLRMRHRPSGQIFRTGTVRYAEGL